MPRMVVSTLLFLSFAVRGVADERTEHFDGDPGWEARNNHRTSKAARIIRQDFGYGPSRLLDGGSRAIGGFITAAAEPAYYAKKLSARSFDDVLTASGTFVCDDAKFHLLLGFFNADTLNEWRTPNSMALRLSGRGDRFFAWLEYATGRWRAGGDSPQGFPTERDPRTGRQRLKGFVTSNVVHNWSLKYDPKGNEGRGILSAVIDGEQAVCYLAEGHKADGALFNRFGLLNVMKSAAGGGEFWLKSVTINGESEDMTQDPHWDAFHNRHTYTTTLTRPFFDFGYTLSNFAGGKRRGELGGLVFRGDCRFLDKMASYADRLGELNLERELRASGKVSLKRGVTDSTVLIGFFHQEDSMAVNSSQKSGLPRCFLGVSTDGPSREGFYFAPVYRGIGDFQGAVKRNAPHIYPDAKAHDWSLHYSPQAAGGNGLIQVTLDQQSVELPLTAGHRAAGARFNRFGLITTWVDGNSQTIYFDDLTYTCK